MSFIMYIFFFMCFFQLKKKKCVTAISVTLTNLLPESLSVTHLDLWL